MKTRVLEAMMCVVMWHDRDGFCKNWQGCNGCPYDLTPKNDNPKELRKVRICDKASTEFVLERAAEAFREYFDEINYLIPYICGTPKTN